MEMCKIFAFCLIVIFALAFTGCSEIKNPDSSVSSENSISSEESAGIELPEEEFDLSEDKNESKDTVTSKNDQSVDTSSEEDSKDGAEEDGSSTPSKDDSDTPTESGDDTSSEVDSSKPDDGSVELPFDKW